jgi:hypothetical protein
LLPTLSKFCVAVFLDPLYNLPFLEQNNFPLLEKPKDIVSKSDKAVVQKVARSLVSVSSVDQGKTSLCQD